MQLQLPGTTFSAWILVDGVEVNIFEPTYTNDQNGPVARCWIASEAGKAFSIHLRDSDRKHASRSNLFLDGVLCHDTLILRRDQNLRDQARFTALPSSSTSARYLTFSSLETIDEGGMTSTEAGNIGEIKVVLEYIEVSPSQRPPGGQTPSNGTMALSQNQKVNEKSKKAGSHRTQLGTEVPQERCTWWSVLQTISPVGTLIFCYRPRDILMAQEIIPRPIEQPKTPSMALNISDDEEEAAVTSEINKLQERLESIRKQKRKRVKKEPGVNERRVKREKRDVPPIVRGEVLDLTELSD